MSGGGQSHVEEKSNDLRDGDPTLLDALEPQQLRTEVTCYLQPLSSSVLELLIFMLSGEYNQG